MFDDNSDWENRRSMARAVAIKIARKSPHLQEDLMQEADIALWQGKLVRNRCIDFLRFWNHLRLNKNGESTLRNTIKIVPLEDEWDGPSREMCPDEIAISNETSREICALLTTLSENERNVIVGQYLLELSQKEIAEKYGYSINTVKWWRKQALQKMREEFLRLGC